MKVERGVTIVKYVGVRTSFSVVYLESFLEKSSFHFEIPNIIIIVGSKTAIIIVFTLSSSQNPYFQKCVE